MIELDTLSDGSQYDYDQTVQLDGVTYRLRMLYNVRREVWSASLYTENDTPLFEGRTCGLNVDLLNRCFVQGRPPGTLFVGTYSQHRDTPGLLDIGQDARYRLIYVPEDELAESE